MIMTIGGDAHKRTHTFVVVDPTGRKIAEHTFTATTEGHIEALTWQHSGPNDSGRWRTAAKSPGGSNETSSAPANASWESRPS
jgi:hypothetical protein